MKGLTKRQRELLSFIQDFIQKQHYSPSYREIMQHFGFHSLGSVYKHINVLKRKGLLTSEKQCSRSLTLSAEKIPMFFKETELPFMGCIKAGFPIETFSKTQSIIVPEYLVHFPEKTYVLKAQGDSLLEELIADGDYLLIEARQNALAGEMVVAMINQHDTFIKRYYPEGEYVRFTSLTAHFQPIIVHPTDFKIQGVLIGLLRRYCTQ